MTLLSFSKRKSIAILVSFLITIAVSRTVVFFIENKIASTIFKYNIIADYHIHHFTYGIVILVIVGFIALFIPNRLERTWIYVMYGLGIGLIFDEFGVWLKLDPDYHQIASIAAVISISVFLIFSAFVEHEYRKFKARKLSVFIENKRKKK